MTKPLSMTFHESYGSLPTNLLRAYKRYGVTTSDHDMILLNCDSSWSMSQNGSVDWQLVLDFVLAHIDNGYFSLPMYL